MKDITKQIQDLILIKLLKYVFNSKSRPMSGYSSLKKT